MLASFELREGPCPETIASPDSGELLGHAPCDAPPAIIEPGEIWEREIDVVIKKSGGIGHYRFKGKGGVCLHQGQASGYGERVARNGFWISNTIVTEWDSVLVRLSISGGAA